MRKILYIGKNRYGSSFVIEKAYGDKDRECEGYGFYSKSFDKDTILLTKFDEFYRAYLINEVKWQRDPKDMFYFKATRLNNEMITDEESEEMEKYIDETN